MDTTIVEQGEAILRRYLKRADRKDSNINFIVREGIRCIIEEGNETNEMVYLTYTTLSLREFSVLVEQTASTPSKVYYIDLIEIQKSFRSSGKTVCYYLVYSEVDKRFKDIIILSS